MKSVEKESLRDRQIETEYREDLAVLRFWRRLMKSESAKQAIDKIMYVVIVNRHRNML